MGKQRDDHGAKVGRCAQPVKDGPVRGSKGLATLRADEASVLARMDANIPLAGLTSGGTRRACRCGVHACPPRSVGERTVCCKIKLFCRTIQWQEPDTYFCRAVLVRAPVGYSSRGPLQHRGEQHVWEHEVTHEGPGARHRSADAGAA
jgi:hypothetical protein